MICHHGNIATLHSFLATLQVYISIHKTRGDGQLYSVRIVGRFITDGDLHCQIYADPMWE